MKHQIDTYKYECDLCHATKISNSEIAPEGWFWIICDLLSDNPSAGKYKHVCDNCMSQLNIMPRK